MMKTKNYLLYCLLLIGGILFGNVPYIHSDVGTLTINRAAMPAEAPAETFEITTSTGEAIPFQGSLFNFGQQSYVEVRGSRIGGSFYSLAALPGAITKITMKLPDTGTFTALPWAPSFSDESIVSSAQNSLEAKTLENPGDVVSWDVDPELGYIYFHMGYSAMANGAFEYITIEYELAASSEYTVTLSDMGATSTLTGATVTLPALDASSACADKGWSFAGWSAVSSGITAADIIPAGEYTPTGNITLYAIYKQETAGAASLMISKDDFAKTTGDQTVVIAASTGEDITVKIQIYNHPNNGLQIRTGNGYAPHNTDAMPGAITKISIKNLDTQGNGYMTLKAALSVNTVLNDVYATIEPTYSQSTGNGENGAVYHWDIDAEEGFRYFSVAPSGSFYFDYIEVQYASDDAPANIVYNAYPPCGEPMVSISPNDKLVMSADMITGTPDEATVTVIGRNLTLDVNFAAAPAWEGFSVSPAKLSPDASGMIDGEVTVKYAPYGFGSTTGTLTITSDEIETITLPIEATGYVSILDTPSITSIAADDCSSFTFQWDYVPFAMSFKIYIEEDGVGIEGSPFTVSNVDTYQATGLTAETTYTCYVIAIAGETESAPSPEETVTLPECPPMPIVTLDNRGTLTTLQGETVTLPSVSPSVDCYMEGWTFAGWSAVSTGITADDLIAVGEYTLTEDITLYAVFTDSEGTTYDVDPACTPFDGFEVPYVQNFDGGDIITPLLPIGWVAHDVNDDGNAWRTIRGYLMDVFYSSPNHLGVGYSYSSDPGTTFATKLDDWVFSPMLHLLPGKSYKVSMRVKARSSGLYSHDFKIYLTTGQEIADATGTPVYEKTIISSDGVGYNYIEQLFSVTEEGYYSIAMFVGADIINEGQIINTFGIDDFAVESGIVVDAVFPEDGTEDIPTNTEVYALFNQDITANELDLSLITIAGGATNVSASIVENKLIIAHDPFPFNAPLTVNIPEGAIDGLAGKTWSFTTVSSEVLMYDYTPADGAKGVFQDANIILQFNKPVTIADVSKITIDNDATGISPRVEGNYLYIDHDRLDTDKTYTVTIAQGAVTGWVGHTWSFSTVKSGTIPDVSAVYGPVYGMINTRYVSDNGRYVTGQSSAYGAIMWDLLEGTDIYPLRTDGRGEGMQVSDDGIVVGSILVAADKGLYGGYWHEGVGNEVEATLQGNLVDVINGNGTILAGADQQLFPWTNREGPISYYVPAIWKLNENGEYKKTLFKQPDTVWQGSKVLDMSADGSISVGWVHIAETGFARLAIYWDAEGNYTMPFGETVGAQFDCISANGKYAGLRKSGVPYVMDMETEELTQMSSMSIIQAITNDGLVIGASGDKISGTYAWVYSEETGTLGFNQYVRNHLNHIDEEVYNKLLGIAGYNTVVYRVSPDGKNWAIQYMENDQYSAYMFHLGDEAAEIKPRPTGLVASVSRETRNVVELTWVKPETTETITGYNIYVNGELEGTAAGDKMNYTDQDALAGYLTYTVSALYGSAESPQSDPAKVTVIDSYNIPFHESFDAGTLETNYWTVDGWDYNEVLLEYGVENTVGLGVAIGNTGKEFSGTITSKPLDASNAEKVYLSYMMIGWYFDYNSSLFTDDTLYIDITTDGTTWTTVDSYQPERFNDWRAEILDLSSYVAGELFNFRFRIEGVNKLEQDDKMWLFDYITVGFETPQGPGIPGDLVFNISDDQSEVRLGWQDSAGLYGLTHAKTFAKKAFGNEGANIIAAQAFDKAELALYEGMYLQSITTTIGNQLVTTATSSFKTAVFVNGERVDSTPVSDFECGVMNTFVLATPIKITADITDLKIGIEVVSHNVNEWPLTTDESYRVVKGKGDLYSEDGGNTWHNLSDLVLTETHRTQSNWHIIGNISAEVNTKDRATYVLGYNLYRDGAKLNTDLQYRSEFTTPFEEGVYSTRACYFSMETGDIELSGESEGVMVKLVSIKPVGNDSGISIYPNPATLYVTIDGEYTRATIYNTDGKAVLVSAAQPRINVSHLAKGVYIIRVESGKVISNHKLVIR